jgi:hypothetical protein
MVMPTPRLRRIERELALVAALLRTAPEHPSPEPATISAADPHTNATEGSARVAPISAIFRHLSPS